MEISTNISISGLSPTFPFMDLSTNISLSGFNRQHFSSWISPPTFHFLDLSTNISSHHFIPEFSLHEIIRRVSTHGYKKKSPIRLKGIKPKLTAYEKNL